MGPNAGESRAFADAASRRKVELEVVHLPQARELYEADYALIRPDQIVAWRGDSGSQAGRIFDQILGTGAALPDAPAKKAIA